MAIAETVVINGMSYAPKCKVCGSGMSCGNALPGRRTHRCHCGATLYVYRIEVADSIFDLDVWPHECPTGMPLGTYVNNLIAPLLPSSG